MARIKPSPIGRKCLVCLADLEDEMGCYVFVGGRCAPHDVLVCVKHGANGASNFSRAEYDHLLAVAMGEAR